VIHGTVTKKHIVIHRDKHVALILEHGDELLELYALIAPSAVALIGQRRFHMSGAYEDLGDTWLEDAA